MYGLGPWYFERLIVKLSQEKTFVHSEFCTFHEEKSFASYVEYFSRFVNQTFAIYALNARSRNFSSLKVIQNFASLFSLQRLDRRQQNAAKC